HLGAEPLRDEAKVDILGVDSAILSANVDVSPHAGREVDGFQADLERRTRPHIDAWDRAAECPREARGGKPCEVRRRRTPQCRSDQSKRESAFEVSAPGRVGHELVERAESDAGTHAVRLDGERTIAMLALVFGDLGRELSARVTQPTESIVVDE